MSENQASSYKEQWLLKRDNRNFLKKIPYTRIQSTAKKRLGFYFFEILHFDIYFAHNLGFEREVVTERQNYASNILTF